MGVLLSVSAMAQETKRVLFVGNSYTEVNNLPQIVSRVAESMGDAIEYSSNTPGGCTFSGHCTNQSMNLICQGGWDVVVLQEQSQYPSFPDGQVANEVFPYAERLVDSVYANSPCGEPMFYMTWGRKNGDERNAQYFPVLGTYEGMDSMLYERYMYMGQTYDASVSPVGRVWRRLRENNPEIELYQADESHPSMAGSYAAGCTFYVMMFGKDPQRIPYDGGIDSEMARAIRETVKTVVYDNLAFWKRATPTANYAWNANGATVSVANQSTNATEYEWLWGDGKRSEGNASSHTYAAAGTYEVTLVASRHCMTDTARQMVTVNEGHVGMDLAEAGVSLYPNPTSGSIRIEAENFVEAQVMDCSGKVVMDHCTAKELDLGRLPKGVYVVRIVTTHQSMTQKVVKQ